MPEFVRNPMFMIIIAVVIILALAVIFIPKVKEGFVSIVPRELAMFPDVFKPQLVEVPKIHIDEQVMTVNLDIGEDKQVSADVSVPAQDVEVPKQVSAVPEKPEMTETKVEAGEVVIPEQVGIIPAVVDNATGAVVGIPVSVPEQAVEVKEQFAYKKVMEGFKI